MTIVLAVGTVKEEEKGKVQQHRLVEGELQKALAGELGRLAVEAQLEPGNLLAEGRRQAPEILEAAEPAWWIWQEADRAERRLRIWPHRGENPFRYILRLGDVLAAAPLLFLALLVGLSGLGVFAVGLVALFTGPTSSDLFLIASALALGSFASRLWRQGWHAAGIGPARERATAAWETYLAMLRRAGVDPWLRMRINAAKARSSETRLAYGDRTGLAEVDDRRHEVPTEIKARLLAAMDDRTMPGGAIGLSGSRGAGKSTLMRSVCRETAGSREVLGVVVEAPVEYEAREFVLHLFAKVCGKVIGPEKVAELRGRNRPVAGSRSLAQRYLSTPGALLGSALFLAGMTIVYGDILEIAIDDLSPVVWGGAVMLVGYVVALLSMSGVFLAHRRSRTARTLLSRSDHHPADVETAMAYLQQIWFQQSFSSGWSGSFKAPIGLEAAISSTTELAARQMSFPDVVDLFRQFLVQISSSRQVRIGIDELDKMDDATAHRFLNEIKVVFRIPGCFFLISISEDAMSFFERRGLPFRDVFDSSIDQVFKVPNLSLDGSKALLDRRVVGLPISFICLLHCMSGGLPRDLIRIARDLVELDQGIELDRAAEELVGAALEAKLGAAEVASRRFRYERHVSTLSTWIDELSAAGADPDALLATCGTVSKRFLAPLESFPEADDLIDERRELRALGKQLTAFAYLAATLLQLLARFSKPNYIDFATGAGRGDQVASPVDRLAGVARSFPMGVDAVWRDLSRLREDLKLKPVAAPVVEGERPAVGASQDGSEGGASLRERLAEVLRGSGA